MYPKLDFLIAGSANDAFLSQIAFFRVCLDALGEEYKQARLVAVLGNHSDESLPERWVPYFSNIDVVWSHPVGEPNPDHRPQHYTRFEVIRPDADLAIVCDADTAMLRPFPDLVNRAKLRPALFGVIAHYHFPWKNTFGNSIADWHYLAHETTGKKIACDNSYTLWPDTSAERAPFYINYGFVAGTPDLLVSLYARECQIIDLIDSKLEPFWGPQVALPLVVNDLDLPFETLPMRYNFPNDVIAEDLHPQEMEEIILMHYLRTDTFNRHEIFASEEKYYEFLEMPLQGSNLIFQKHCINLFGHSYPFTF